MCVCEDKFVFKNQRRKPTFLAALYFAFKAKFTQQAFGFETTSDF